MSARRVGCLPALVCSLAAAAALGAEPEEPPPLVSVIRQVEYELFDTGDPITVRVPVTLGKGVVVEDLEVFVSEVLFGQVQNSALLDLFEVSIAGPQDQRPAALVVRVARVDRLRAGKYAFTVGVRRKAAGAAKNAPETLHVELTHPGAELHPVATFLIGRTRGAWYWPFHSVDVDDVRLQLLEKTRRSRISDIQIRQLGPAKLGERPVSGLVKFAAPESVAPGGHAYATPTLAGDFPPGTVSGSVEIAAPQLAAPVTVSFQVETRAHIALLFWVATAGLLFSLLTKQELAVRIQRGEALGKAEELLDALRREATRRHDQAFQVAADQIESSLRGVLVKRSPQEIAEEVKKLEGQLDTALTAFNAKRGTIAEAIDAFADAVRAAAAVTVAPEALEDVRAALVQAREAVREAGSRLAANELAAAQDRVENGKQQLASSLDAEVSARELRLAAFEHFANDGEIVLPVLIATPLRTHLGRARGHLEAAKGADKTAAPRLAVFELAQLHRSLAEVVHAFDTIRATVLHVAARLREGRNALRDRIEHLERATQELSGELGRFEPEGRFEALDRALRGVLAAAREAIVAQGASTASTERIEEALAAGQYERAAQLAAPHEPAATRARAAIDGPDEGVDTFRIPQDGLPAPRMGEAPIAEGFVPGVPTRVEERPAPLGTLLYDTRRALAWEKAVQSLLLLLVLLPIAYALFGEGFTGSWRELASIFSWAWAVDITIEAVRTQAGKVKV